jgi:hypothetical protein
MYITTELVHIQPYTHRHIHAYRHMYIATELNAQTYIATELA